MDVIKVTPRGYCYGVVDAMEIARKAARDPSLPRPIYIIGLIVHNRFAVEELNRLGVLTLDGSNRAAILDQASEGTVIFTAHGVSPRVKERAHERGLHVIDATCPDVTKTHNLVLDFAARGYQILYIGKKGHPEPEGVVGEAPDAVYLVETEADLDALPERILHAENLMVTLRQRSASGTRDGWLRQYASDSHTPRSTTRFARRRRTGRRQSRAWRKARI